jgi:hypothetical protein
MDDRITAKRIADAAIMARGTRKPETGPNR